MGRRVARPASDRPSGAGRLRPGPVPARLPRRRSTRATLLPSLFLVVLPLVVVRTIGAHAGPLEPAMTAFTVPAAAVSLVLLRLWLGGLAGGGGSAGPQDVRRDIASGTAHTRRVRVGPAVWTGQSKGSWSASRRLELSADDTTIALRTANEESPQFPWLDLESAGVLRGREGRLCWAGPGRSWGEATDQVGAALVTDDGSVVWGSTDRRVAEAAWTPGRSQPTEARRVRRAPRACLYRPDVHRYGPAMAAVTLVAFVVAGRGVLPDPLSWCPARPAACTAVRGAFGFTGRLAGRPGPGWETSASVRAQRERPNP
ncbi:hypothetical protein [Streptomyces sp. NRRL S-813]|uniref:hypothetical protein n=1 Tax=Streptomyces sp. NRRL S-813 TaxID=1463919 RepID=UPI00131C8120|nr:hypothetical protein [Streptomyces sp. NRRL S-813]